ncbi:MAG: ComEC/Rec2 family competence protein [Agathobaculum sp.]|uniref:ComEC/Rec2 family competence protein n=1 Tax=Agathobaculum sp. TaxID=2048138 RepID=UPI003D8C8833
MAGLSHLVAVSGLHIGFLVAFCYLLFGRKYGTVLSIPMILLFVPVAGATPSVIRAAVMYLITAGAFLCRREANSLNSLFVALALLLVINPYAIASLSLQLSFMATLGLILFSGKMQRRLSRPFQKCGRFFRKVAAIGAGAISCSVCAMLFTIPILLTAFGYVSVLSVLSNLLVTGITSICFIAGFLLCLCARFLPIAVPALAKVEEVLLGAMIAIAEWVAGLPFGLVSGQDGFFVAALLSAMGALWLWLLIGKRVKWKIILPVVCVAVAALTAVGVYDKNSHYTITFLPCGTGQAILVSDAAQQHTTLVDCAGDGGYHDAAASVQEWMRWHGVRKIDTLILTAADKGHARDLPALFNHTAVESVWMPAQCRKTKHNTEILDLLDRAPATPVEEKTVLNTESVPVTAFPITAGKLGVLIGRQVLVLHSPTQKQLSAFWQTGEQYTAPIVVLAQRNLEDDALLRETLCLTKAEKLIIQAGSKEFLPAYEGIPTQSPYLTGELCIRYKKEEAQWQ